MKGIIKRYIVLTLGWAFILLGIAGVFLPILQGILFLFIGLYLLSQESSTAKKMLEKTKKRYPSLVKKLDQAKAKHRKIMNKLFKR